MVFQGKRKLAPSTFIPYPLNGIEDIEFDAKVDVDDTSPVFIYKQSAGQINVSADGTAPGAQFSEMGVQMSPSDTTPPRTLHYRLRVKKAGRYDTVDRGYLRVVNT